MAITDEDKAAWRKQIVDLREVVQELERDIHRLDIILKPVLVEEERAKAEIRKTMPFKLGDGARRKPAYDKLLEISVEWGKMRNERRDLFQRMRAYERRIESLGKMLAKEDKRRDKA